MTTTPTPARAANVDTFIEHYAGALEIAVQTRPQDYAWAAGTTTETVIARMRQAMIAGTYSHDGRAIAITCKALGIKHTRRAMEAYFNFGTK